MKTPTLSVVLRIGLAGLTILVAGLLLPVTGQAAPLAQMTPFPTPTPGPDGRILYTVQPGDTLWRVAAISGLTVSELRALNGIGADEVIVPGQTLLLGIAGPALQTPTAGPAPAHVTPTPTAQPGTATLCILLFNDRNGDAVRQEEESGLPGGAVSITRRDGEVSITDETQGGTEPQCYEDLPAGDYNISIAVPTGYNPTTLMNYGLTLQGGDETYVDFGAQANSAQAAAEEILPEPGKRSPLLGILGVLLVLAGLGLGVYLWFGGREQG